LRIWNFRDGSIACCVEGGDSGRVSILSVWD